MCLLEEAEMAAALLLRGGPELQKGQAAKPQVKQAATAVIGHHDEDGIARFLRERFALPPFTGASG